MARISASVLYFGPFKAYILIKLNVYDVKFVSIDRQMLDISKNVYLCYRKFYIVLFCEHKIWPSYP